MGFAKSLGLTLPKPPCWQRLQLILTSFKTL